VCQSKLNQSNSISTLAPRTAKHVSSSSYQRARVNLFIPHAERQQLNALSAEWDLPLVETARRVIHLGLSGIMHGDAEWAPAPTEKGGAPSGY
jgi:hypothetical protein